MLLAVSHFKAMLCVCSPKSDIYPIHDRVTQMRRVKSELMPPFGHSDADTVVTYC